MVRIPLDIVTTTTGHTTKGVLVGVMASDLDALLAERDQAVASVERLLADMEELRAFFKVMEAAMPKQYQCRLCDAEPQRPHLDTCPMAEVQDHLRAFSQGGVRMSDERCQDCGRTNVVWFTDNALWNLVVGGPDAPDDPGGILCPTCFIERAEKHGIKPTAWKLGPEGGHSDATE